MSAILGKLSAVYPIDRFVTENGPDPFRILVGCILSLRTKDEVTYPATARLFAKAKDPQGMSKLSHEVIANTIYPVGFYRTKAKQIREIAAILLARHEGRVPDTIEDLLDLPGVGRKTANLTVTLGFGKPGICRGHARASHRNRLGWVSTKTPEETESALRDSLPKRWWIPINETLVRHGQQVCKPISPICSVCAVSRACPKRGVVRHR
jgi:endonuclease-3